MVHAAENLAGIVLEAWMERACEVKTPRAYADYFALVDAGL